MLTKHLKTRVDDDGLLRIDLGLAQAGREVAVTVESPTKPALTDAEWMKIFRETAGSITDERFQRPPQLPLDPIPEFD